MTETRKIIDWRVPASQAWDKSEHELQVALVNRSLLLSGKHPSVLLLHAVPNGGKRDRVTAYKLKAEGVIPGVPDICMPVARGGFHGFYMELKNKIGRVKPEQWEFMEALHAEGYFVRVTNNLATAFEILKNYLEEMP